MERNAWRAARSAGCSQETAEISGKVRRGRWAGRVVLMAGSGWGRDAVRTKRPGVSHCDVSVFDLLASAWSAGVPQGLGRCAVHDLLLRVFRASVVNTSTPSPAAH